MFIIGLLTLLPRAMFNRLHQLLPCRHLNKNNIGRTFSKIILALIAFLFTLSSKALAQSLPSCDFVLLDFFINFLPETPDSIKLSNVLTEFAIQAPIGSAVIFEAYSGIFQVLTLIAFFKAIKILVYFKKLLLF